MLSGTDTNTPSVECLGVYVATCDDVAWKEDLDRNYHSLGCFVETEEYRRRVLPIVLVEVLVTNAAPSFNVGEFHQFMERDDRSPQVAYDEALLAPDGESVVARRQGCADGMSNGRICFFLHYYDPQRPIQWSFGEFRGPPPLPMTERLARLMPYNPI